MLVLTCAAAMWGCEGGRSPVSPSSLAQLTAPDSSVRAGQLHDQPAVPGPDPAPTPSLEPEALTISIVGSFGITAFAPNPLVASVGNMVVWTNNDTILHDIRMDDVVLSDGTVVGGAIIGSIEPGASSLPMSLTTPTATYHCTIHPSMVGSISDQALPPPEPGDPPVDPYPPDDY
jgi:plastocyanin